MVTASAPGKVILLGEHAAVYGNPVLVATVNLRTYVTVEESGNKKFKLTNKNLGIKNFSFRYTDFRKLKKNRNLLLTIEAIERIGDYIGEKSCLDIKINSDIPVASGLGSSASMASAMVLAASKELCYNLKKKEIANLAWDIENVIHRKSSGVDPFAVTYGGVIRYKRGNAKRLEIKKYPEITIGNTNISSDTGVVVSDVMELKNNFPEFFSDYLKIMEIIVNNGEKFLKTGDIKKFGAIMNINHGLLSAIGVSSSELESLVWAARRKSPGAKLCGAGRGGIMVALGDAGREIEKAGGSVIRTRICNEGVRIENFS